MDVRVCGENATINQESAHSFHPKVRARTLQYSGNSVCVRTRMCTPQRFMKQQEY